MKKILFALFLCSLCAAGASAAALVQDSPAKAEVAFRYAPLDEHDYARLLKDGGGREFLDNLGYKLESKTPEYMEREYNLQAKKAVSREKSIKDSLAMLEKNKDVILSTAYFQKRMELEDKLKEVRQKQKRIREMVSVNHYAPPVQNRVCAVQGELVTFGPDGFIVRTDCDIYVPNLNGRRFTIEIMEIKLYDEGGLLMPYRADDSWKLRPGGKDAMFHVIKK